MALGIDRTSDWLRRCGDITITLLVRQMVARWYTAKVLSGNGLTTAASKRLATGLTVCLNELTL